MVFMHFVPLLEHRVITVIHVVFVERLECMDCMHVAVDRARLHLEVTTGERRGMASLTGLHAVAETARTGVDECRHVIVTSFALVEIDRGFQTLEVIVDECGAGQIVGRGDRFVRRLTASAVPRFQ